MKTKEELFEVFGKGENIVTHEEKVVKPVVIGKQPDVLAEDGVTIVTVGADIVEDREVTEFVEEVKEPYFFYANEKPPAAYIQWASDNVPVHHSATLVEDVLYVAVTSEISVPGLVAVI